MKTDFEWVCNECNFTNFTSSMNEDEIEQELHACINCGCFEMHKKFILNPTSPMKTEDIEKLFLEKYGNKITASESWVIRFAEDCVKQAISSSPEQKKPLSDELKSLDIVIRCHKDMIGLSTTPKEDKKVLNDLIKIRSFIKNK